MKAVDPKIYTKKYYQHDCLGAEAFFQSNGTVIPERTKMLVDFLPLKKHPLRILDIGCGRGDIIFLLAKKKIDAYGIDYAKDGIALAKQILKKQPKNLQQYAHFTVMDAKKLSYPDNYFDAVISIDVFEHLYHEELLIALQEMKRVLKKEGTLIVHTEPNKINLDVTHPYYLYPVSELLLFLNRIVTHKIYPGFPKDPRNDLHKAQHVNEPTYFYLRDLFAQFGFEGSIKQCVDSLKPVLSWKDRIYNVLVYWYPLCLIPPFIYFFAYGYIAVMKNKK